MKIKEITSWTKEIPLTCPYTIAYRSFDKVEMAFVRIDAENGLMGLGSASPGAFVTGESFEDCRAAMADSALGWLLGCDLRLFPALGRQVASRMANSPAARAAVDMAILDLYGQYCGVPLIDILGGQKQSLPTSVTIGIKNSEETLDDAEKYLKSGFRYLKVKVGSSLEEDLERIVKLRERFGNEIKIRIDANQGYTADEFSRFARETDALDVELHEQPLPKANFDDIRSYDHALRAKIAADESLINEKDAWRLAGPPPHCGIFNIKLMKCGGISPALRIATFAEAAGLELMWGCMDESRISISAALHAAMASPRTRYLDLDGSFDLASDVVSGGFRVVEGEMQVLDRPGLGVRMLE